MSPVTEAKMFENLVNSNGPPVERNDNFIGTTFRLQLYAGKEKPARKSGVQKENITILSA